MQLYGQILFRNLGFALSKYIYQPDKLPAGE